MDCRYPFWAVRSTNRASGSRGYGEVTTGYGEPVHGFTDYIHGRQRDQGKSEPASRERGIASGSVLGYSIRVTNAAGPVPGAREPLMQRFTVDSIQGTVFPAGRHTRVLVGDGAPVRARHFQIGRVCVFPGGGVPEHEHPNEEVYIALEGQGEITVAGETAPFPAGSYVYLPPHTKHSLSNPGEREFVFQFVFAPADTVEHWQQEKDGALR